MSTPRGGRVRRVASVNLALLVALLLLVLLVAGCGRGGEPGGSQEEETEETTQQQEEEPISGTFVGDDVFVIEDNSKVDAFLALVAKEPQVGEDQPEVRAYLCDGRTINEWFDEGSVEGSEFDLTSDGGAQLLGSLKRDVDSSWISGQILLADGTVLGFGAPPATTGIGGLYDVTISGGQLSGTSDGGAQLEGRLADTLQEDGLYPASGTITPSDGQPPQDFQAFVTPDASGELRWIVLEDGRIKGGFKQGEGAGFAGQNVDI